MATRKYKKKPVTIEAMQFLGTYDSYVEIKKFVGDHIRLYNEPCPKSLELVLETLEGDMVVYPHAYIIKGVRGEFYPCRRDIFEETYVEV